MCLLQIVKMPHHSSAVAFSGSYFACKIFGHIGTSKAYEESTERVSERNQIGINNTVLIFKNKISSPPYGPFAPV